ncbi:alpha/beta hydrolase [Luedemannella helvata]|uniref:Alpha/beta hydrolase n=1 Tax=Luedemannella helvata TaxID=349315 RepID=A0ABN2JR75_9ACTN
MSRTEHPEARIIVTPDGRRLTVETTGAERGRPVFLLHGTPGSRRGPKPRSSVLYRLGVRLICYDRPGYGGSDRHEGRTVADAAADVRAIADSLGIERFSVVGRSGGGPHALACAALLPDRVASTAVLVGVAPVDAAGLDWFGGMTQANVREYTDVATDAAALTERLRLLADRTATDPESLLDFLREQMTSPDRHVTNRVAVRRLLADTYVEALRAGPHGWVDDAVALRGVWGFSVDQINAPVRLWHGLEDNFTPVSHSRWLASRIPGAELVVEVETAHFGAVGILPSILAWLVSKHSDCAAPEPFAPC